MIRALTKRLTTSSFRYSIRTQLRTLRERGAGEMVRWNGVLIDAAVRERLHRSRYVVLTDRQLIDSRKSDTVYVFGSGYSLNDTTPEQWRVIERHDTMGINMSIHEQWVRMDYHVLRGGVEGSTLKWRAYAEDFCRTIAANPHYRNTIFLLQGEYYGQFGNQIVGYELLPARSRIYRFHTARGEGLPTRSLREGLRHAQGTLSDAVNAAAVIGWRNIVLAGVDLYDSRYFWLKPDEVLEMDPATGMLRAAAINVRGHRAHEAHNTAQNGIVRTMGQWREHLERERGIQLSVLNPRSLLASVMPVHQIGVANE